MSYRLRYNFHDYSYYFVQNPKCCQFLLTKKRIDHKKVYFATAPLVEFKDIQKVLPIWLSEEELCNRKSYKAKSLRSYELCSFLIGIELSTLKDTDKNLAFLKDSKFISL